jgi:DNA mismatch repair protein MutL
VSRIHRLPTELANQIAAGEVVERPASVVKELVENALDAGARRIGIAVDFGGKKLIAVEDDGGGMTRDEAELAVERHATSKISTAGDLAAIRTLGFRGEALPSIASVSRFRLRTRARGAVGGVELRLDGGRLVSVRDAGAPEGTLVEVVDLFFNLPARRKFLKADTAEAAQISRLVTQLALGYPEVGFVLTSGGRTLIETPPACSADERFYQVYGERTDLVPVEKDAAGIRVHGFVAALAEQGPVRGPQHVFVNRRVVRDRTIAHAIQQAYSAASIKERGPEVHLFVEIAPDRVDVNVHPTKAEVRFLDQGLVHEILRRAVVDALGQAPVPELVLAPAIVPGRGPQPQALGLAWARGPGPVAPEELPGPGARGLGPDLDPRVATAPGRETVAALIQPMTPLGQFRNTFIIAVDDEGLAIVDQHVAHERVLFEQIAERLISRPLEAQRLIGPIVLDLDPGGHQTLVQHRDALARLGFEIEAFGGTALQVIAVPALLDWTRIDAALRAIAADLDGLAPRDGADAILRRMAATMACHAAVKANDPLTREKMQYLLDELRRTAHSSVCPHGRPVVLRLTRREIEKNFERT